MATRRNLHILWLSIKCRSVVPLRETRDDRQTHFFSLLLVLRSKNSYEKFWHLRG